MQTLKMKVVGFEEETKSLIVSFASDETASDDPSNYTPFAFQPINMWPGVIDPEEIKKQIAITGVSHAAQQALRESAPASDELVDAMKTWVGETFTFTEDDLTVPAQFTTPFHTV
jgi:hypothetical protein